MKQKTYSNLVNNDISYAFQIISFKIHIFAVLTDLDDELIVSGKIIFFCHLISQSRRDAVGQASICLDC